MSTRKKKAEVPVVEEPLQPYGSEHLTFEKVWLMFQETDRQFKETDRRIKQLTTMLTSNWGRLMEALISPSCLRLFKERGFDIHRTYTNIKIETPELEGEFDIVLANGDHVVVIEVKTNCKVEDVDYFLSKMARIREYFPDFSRKTIIGGVATIAYHENSDKYAYRKGLFVIKNAGEGLVKIANRPGFEPLIF